MHPSQVYANLGWPGIRWDVPGGGGVARSAPIAVIADIVVIARDRRTKTSETYANPGWTGRGRG